MTTVDDLLKQGIDALNMGQKEKAHSLFMQIVERDKHNEMAWLWLSGTVDTDEDRHICLKNVLVINPDSEVAQRGLEKLQGGSQGSSSGSDAATRKKEAELRPIKETRTVRSRTTSGKEETTTDKVTALLQQAVAAIKNGEKERGEHLLWKIIEQDENNEIAWLWMARCMTGYRVKRECFERVLEINPNNEFAKEGLRKLDALDILSEAKSSPTTVQHKKKPGENRAEKKGGLGAAGWGCLIIILLAVLGTCLGDQASSPPTPTVSSYEKQAAIRTVQEYEASEGVSVITGVTMGLILIENDGYSVEVSGWNARRESNRWVVEFVFYADGDRETALWWHVPDSGLVVPKNEWAEAFMGY